MPSKLFAKRYRIGLIAFPYESNFLRRMVVGGLVIEYLLSSTGFCVGMIEFLLV